jgi:hypothetical protein
MDEVHNIYKAFRLVEKTDELKGVFFDNKFKLIP